MTDFSQCGAFTSIVWLSARRYCWRVVSATSSTALSALEAFKALRVVSARTAIVLGLAPLEDSAALIAAPMARRSSAFQLTVFGSYPICATPL